MPPQRMGGLLQPAKKVSFTFPGAEVYRKIISVFREVADNFVAALWEVEKNVNVEPLVELHTEDCEVGNVSVPETFDGHDGMCEF
jgi:hypothetical protein